MRIGGAVAKRCNCNAPNCQGFIGGHQNNSHIMMEANSEDEEDLEPIMIEEELDDDVEVNTMNPINTKVEQAKNSHSTHNDNWTTSLSTTSNLEVGVKRKLQTSREENSIHPSMEQMKRTKMSTFFNKPVGLGLKQPHGACATFKYGNAHENNHNNSYSDGKLCSSIIEFP